MTTFQGEKGSLFVNTYPKFCLHVKRITRHTIEVFEERSGLNQTHSLWPIIYFFKMLKLLQNVCCHLIAYGF